MIPHNLKELPILLILAKIYIPLCRFFNLRVIGSCSEAHMLSKLKKLMLTVNICNIQNTERT